MNIDIRLVCGSQTRFQHTCSTGQGLGSNIHAGLLTANGSNIHVGMLTGNVLDSNIHASLFAGYWLGSNIHADAILLATETKKDCHFNMIQRPREQETLFLM